MGEVDMLHLLEIEKEKKLDGNIADSDLNFRLT